MSKLKVVILGSGPSAAYAHRAATDFGADTHVIAATDPTRTRGAFWLTWMPLSCLLIPKWEITVVGSGKSHHYMTKQWGREFADFPCSFPDGSYKKSVYDPDLGLKALFTDASIEVSWLEQEYILTHLCRAYDLVVQTFPMRDDHRTMPPVSKVWVASLPSASQMAQKGVCVYNGIPEIKWVRMTDAFGEVNIEFAREEDINHYPGIANASHSRHWYPNLHPNTKSVPQPGTRNLLLTGRFARWDRRELSHHSYARVTDALRGL